MTTRAYMIEGFETPNQKPAPWELALIWKNGRETLWPGRTQAEALAHLDKISIRPDLMRRIEIRSYEFRDPLWDASWGG